MENMNNHESESKNNYNIDNGNNISTNFNNNNINQSNGNNQKTDNSNMKQRKWKTTLRKTVPFILVGIICFSLGFGLDRMFINRKNRKILRGKPGFNEKIKKFQNTMPRGRKRTS